MLDSMLVMSSGGSGGNPSCYAFSFTRTEMDNATDANPIVLQGDFSNIKTIVASGKYNGMSTGSYGNVGSAVVTNITLGNVNTITFVTAPGTGWRNVTVYSDRVEIGSGGYSGAVDSTYGTLEGLSLFDRVIHRDNTD